MCVSITRLCVWWNTFPQLSPPSSHYYHLSILYYPISTHKTNTACIFYLISHHFPFHFTFRKYGSMNCSRPYFLFLWWWVMVVVTQNGNVAHFPNNTVFTYSLLSLHLHTRVHSYTTPIFIYVLGIYITFALIIFPSPSAKVNKCLFLKA